MNDTAALSGQVALVTGASSGLGRATALALGRPGARVALLARSGSDLANVADTLTRNGGAGLPVACDLADAGGVEGRWSRCVGGMVDAGQRTIVNLSSVAGRCDWANASAYCASKFALTRFTQALGAEVRPHGVRARVVYPARWRPTGAHGRPRTGPTGEREPANPREALPPEAIANFIAWIATAPPSWCSTKRSSRRWTSRAGRSSRALHPA